CRMTPPSQNSSHTHQNQRFPSKPTICAQLKMYVFSFISQWITKFNIQLSISISVTITSTFVQHPHSIDYFTTANILQFGFCTEHSYLGNILSESIGNLKICIQKNIVVCIAKFYKTYSKQGPVNTIDLHLFYCVQNGKDSDTKIFIAVIFPHYMYILQEVKMTGFNLQSKGKSVLQ